MPHSILQRSIKFVPRASLATSDGISERERNKLRPSAQIVELTNLLKDAPMTKRATQYTCRRAGAELAPMEATLSVFSVFMFRSFSATYLSSDMNNRVSPVYINMLLEAKIETLVFIHTARIKLKLAHFTCSTVPYCYVNSSRRHTYNVCYTVPDSSSSSSTSSSTSADGSNDVDASGLICAPSDGPPPAISKRLCGEDFFARFAAASPRLEHLSLSKAACDCQRLHVQRLPGLAAALKGGMFGSLRTLTLTEIKGIAPEHLELLPATLDELRLGEGTRIMRNGSASTGTVPLAKMVDVLDAIVRACSHLRLLALSEVGGLTHETAPLCRLRQLRTLHITQYEFTGLMRELQLPPSLTDISFSGTELTGRLTGLPFRDMGHLRRLDLSATSFRGTDLVTTAPFFSHFSVSLQEINLRAAAASLKNIAPEQFLRDLPDGLRRLYLSNCSFADVVTPLEQLFQQLPRRIEEMRLANCGLRGSVVSFADLPPTLRELDLSLNRLGITPEFAQQLAQTCPYMSKLDLSDLRIDHRLVKNKNNNNSSGSSKILIDVAPLASLAYLNSLTLRNLLPNTKRNKKRKLNNNNNNNNNNKIGNSVTIDLRPLAALQHLSELDLSRNRNLRVILGDVLAPKLTVLQLNDAEVVNGGATLDALRAQNLLRLQLSHCRIDAMPTFANWGINLPSLRNVDLDGMAITTARTDSDDGSEGSGSNSNSSIVVDLSRMPPRLEKFRIECHHDVDLEKSSIGVLPGEVRPTTAAVKKLLPLLTCLAYTVKVPVADPAKKKKKKSRTASKGEDAAAAAAALPTTRLRSICWYGRSDDDDDDDDDSYATFSSGSSSSSSDWFDGGDDESSGDGNDGAGNNSGVKNNSGSGGGGDEWKTDSDDDDANKFDLDLSDEDSDSDSNSSDDDEDKDLELGKEPVEPTREQMVEHAEVTDDLDQSDIDDDADEDSDEKFQKE